MSLFKLLNKYRPETTVEKRARLHAAAQAKADGKQVDAGKKPFAIKYGLNHVTALIEAKKAQLVIIPDNVDPIELVVWLPALCRKMDIPYAIINDKARLGALVHKKTAAAICITDVRPEDKAELATLTTAIRSKYNEKADEIRRTWGGGVLGFKSQMAKTLKEKAKAKEIQLEVRA
mgnify:FL=1